MGAVGVPIYTRFVSSYLVGGVAAGRTAEFFVELSVSFVLVLFGLGFTCVLCVDGSDMFLADFVWW